VAAGRGEAGDRIVRAAPMRGQVLAGTLFCLIAVAAAGLPPLTGFIGKALLLKAALDAPWVAWVFAIVLIGSLLNVVALARAGIQVFWHVSDEPAPEAGPPWRMAWRPVALLVSVSLALAVFAGPVVDYAARSAALLADGSGYSGELLARGAEAARR
jgi:multicomponent K+:H+ antiporter subunit D